MTEQPNDISALVDRLIAAHAAAHGQAIESRLVRVFGTIENAEKELRDSPLSLFQTPEGNLYGELPTLRMTFNCRECGVEQAGPIIWTPKELQECKRSYGKWQCVSCRMMPGG